MTRDEETHRLKMQFFFKTEEGRKKKSWWKKEVWSVFNKTMLLHSRDKRTKVFYIQYLLGLRTLLAPFINLFLKLENKWLWSSFAPRAHDSGVVNIRAFPLPSGCFLWQLFSFATQICALQWRLLISCCVHGWLGHLLLAWTCWQFPGREGLILQRREKSMIYKCILYYSTCKKLELERHFSAFFCTNSLPRFFYFLHY